MARFWFLFAALLVALIGQAHCNDGETFVFKQLEPFSSLNVEVVDTPWLQSVDLNEITPEPTAEPSQEPTMPPSPGPTMEPTQVPSASPTMEPTLAPSAGPTMEPTVAPSQAPTLEPTLVPSSAPTLEPTLVPSSAPTVEPTMVPTGVPTIAPTMIPTVVPTVVPSVKPTIAPTQRPTAVPTTTRSPTAAPSFQAQPVVSVNAAMTFSGAQSTELTVDDQLIVRQALLQSLQGTVSGLTLDNVVYLYAEAARRALAIAATKKTKAKTSASTQSVSVLVHCAVVLPIVDFPQYSSNVTALSQSVSSQITTSANDGSLLAAVQTAAAALETPSASVFNGVTGLAVTVVESVQQPPTFFPTAAPTAYKMKDGDIAGAVIGVLAGVAAFLVAIYYFLVRARESKSPAAPAAKPAEEVVEMSKIFADKDNEVEGPEAITINVAPAQEHDDHEDVRDVALVPHASEEL